MTDAYRKVALTLHAMGAEDCSWMLQQFGEDERARLSGLLRELRQLGIRSDAAISAALAGEEARQLLLGSAGVDRASTERALDALCAAQPEEVAALLADESDTAVAAVLAAYPWSWRACLPATSGIATRLRVNPPSAQTRSMPPKARAALIRLMAGRLSTLRAQPHPAARDPQDETPAKTRTPRKRSIWHGLTRWLP